LLEKNAEQTNKNLFLIISSLIESVITLHQNNIFHGHLVSSNVAVVQGRAVLIDIGLAALSSHRLSLESIAPELKKGLPISVATDVYGVGYILNQLPKGLLSLEQEQTINSALSFDPDNRPSLSWLRDVFSREFRSKTYTQVQVEPKKAEFQENAIEAQVANATIPTPLSILYNSTKIYNLLLTVIILGILVLAFLKREKIEYLFFSEEIPYSDFWLSSSISKMRRVAKAAVEFNDEEAQFAIIYAAREGKDIHQVNSELIRLASDPKWDADFSTYDKQAFLSLALIRFYQNSATRNAIDYSKLHPRNVLIMMAFSPIRYNPIFAKFSTDYLNSLESSIAEGFNLLGNLGVKNLGDVQAIALAHLLLNRVSKDAIEYFFLPSIEQNGAAILSKLHYLLPKINKEKEVQEGIFLVLKSKENIVGELINWFLNSKLKLWSDADYSKILDLTVNELSDITDLDKLADLVKFPRKKISDKASLLLSKKLGGDNFTKLFLSYFKANSERLSREQLVSLASILDNLNSSEHQVTHTLTLEWFSTAPDPKAVVDLLLLRNSIILSENEDNFTRRLDPLSVGAAQYLTELINDFKPDKSTLSKLIIHPEVLVRSYVYRHLDPLESEERELLETALLIEPDKTLRDNLASRLEETAKLIT
jgi:serine/threonine protein kinase